MLVRTILMPAHFCRFQGASHRLITAAQRPRKMHAKLALADG